MNHYVKGFISSLLIASILANSIYYWMPRVEAKEPEEPAKQLEPIVLIVPEPKVEEVEKEIIETEEPEIVEEVVEEPDPLATPHEYTECLTKRGGVYWNPYTGLKETWYSQRVLPGGGLNIPGRHVNEEGFVCDEDGYICLASSTYEKGTIVETSRGMGKVYDCGCAPGIIDLYVDW